MHILLVAINAKYIHSNLGVYSLLTYAKERSGELDISIKEYTINNSPADIIEDIYSEKPDFIAFSTYIWNISYVNLILPELKKLLPNLTIWLGGPEVSYRSEDYLLSMDEPFVKGIMCGEGEETFYELLCAYNASVSPTDNELSAINGISFVKAKSPDTVISTAPRKALDMDTLPFIYDRYDREQFANKIIYYESSRGCPFSCSYCLSSIHDSMAYVRYRSLDLVKKELLFFLDNSVPQVKFVDRTFNCDSNRTYLLWEFISEHDNGVTNFHFELAGDLLNDRELKLLSTLRPGLVQFEIGVQTTNPKTLEAIHRKTDFDRLVSNVKEINSFGNIHLHLDLIAGLPYEDAASFRDSFNDLYEMKPDELQLGFLKVLSGSFMSLHREDYGLVTTSFPPYEVLFNKWLSHDEVLVLKCVEDAVEKYYNSHQFDNTLSCLLPLFKSPFDFYWQLGVYFQTKQLVGQKHNRITLYKLLISFVSTVLGGDCLDTLRHRVIIENQAIYLSLRQLLVMDVYLREAIKSRPDFAIDLHPYAKTLTALRKENGLGNQEHLEVFTCDCQTLFIHFDYKERSPINQAARLHILHSDSISAL